jgi:hypothetical protein
VKVAARKKVLPRPPPEVRVWPYKATDPAAPQWPEDNYEVAKSDVFHVRSRYTLSRLFFLLFLTIIFRIPCACC